MILAIARPDALLSFVVVNALLHLVIDFVVSRIAARFREQEPWRPFFMVLGADQLLHQICLIVTLSVLTGQAWRLP